MALSEISLPAFGKINLLLDVGKTREDGFHEVSMLMQEVDVADEVKIVLSEKGGTHLLCSIPELSGDKNIAFRAARLMQQNYHLPDVLIEIQKNIPLEAGMAGGSTDAACVIEGMDRMFELGLSLQDKEEMGALLGSDVPFFFSGGTCLCSGRGEVVQKLKDLPSLHIVLMKPPFGISTPWSYKMFDEKKAAAPTDVRKMIRAVETQNVEEVISLMHNHLERAALEKYPVLIRMKEDLIAAGAVTSMMTGSGPTVFGLFINENKAAEAAEQIKEKYPEPVRIIRTATHKKGAPRAIFHEYRN